MRVLTYYQTNRGGGFFKWLLDLIETMLGAGWEVHYISTGEYPVSHKNLHYHAVSPKGPEKLPFFLRFAGPAKAEADRLLSSTDFDLIIAPGILDAYITHGVKEKHKVPVAAFVHGDAIKEQEVDKGKIAASLVKRYSAKGASSIDRIFMSNKDLLEKTIRRFNYPRDNIEILHYNNIDRKRFKPMPKNLDVLKKYAPEGHPLEGRKIVGCVSGLDKVKDVGTALRAFRELAHSVDAVMFVVGAGGEEQKLKALTKELGLESHVIFTGFVENEDLPALINSLDLYVITSIYEGYPLSLLEALSCGVACIGSDVGGIREALEVDDLLIPQGNPFALAVRMKEILSDERRHMEIVELCKQQAKRNFAYDWKKGVIGALEAVSK